uniref:Sulfatase N-terminal domain-containing protein n=1 Tax=Globodera rostochiensis TaxID=31243 RepID=A0A914HW89_GLORO
MRQNSSSVSIVLFLLPFLLGLVGVRAVQNMFSSHRIVQRAQSDNNDFFLEAADDPPLFLDEDSVVSAAAKLPFWRPLPPPSAPSRPNILVLMVDDLGYGDLQSYGNPTQEWTSLDELMAEGVRFTNAYACRFDVFPKSCWLHDRSSTHPSWSRWGESRVLKYGYTTGMVGKWHLGINAFNHSDGTYLPSRRGFDFVGLNLPFTNNWECDETKDYFSQGPNPLKCFLYSGDEIVQQPIKFENLTEDLLADWRRFLEGYALGRPAKPFFFYFSYPHVHSTQFANDNFRGKSERGLFGDNLNEMAWSVGQIVADLRKYGLDRNTLVIFMSDHGPHQELCNNGGSTAGLKGGKSNSYEGGFRIPFAAWMPGTVRQGVVSNEVISSLDLFPTFEHIAKREQNPDLSDGQFEFRPQRKIDGVDIWPELLGYSAANGVLYNDVKYHLSSLKVPLSERRPLFFYCNQKLMAIRWNNYKVHYMASPIFKNFTKDPNLEEFCPGGKPRADWYVSQTCPESQLIRHEPPLVYDLYQDPYELYPLVDNEGERKVGDVLEKVSRILTEHRRSIVRVPEQLGHFSREVNPCCDPPKCQCDYLKNGRRQQQKNGENDKMFGERN